MMQENELFRTRVPKRVDFAPLDECCESRFAGYLVNALRVGFLESLGF